MKISKFSSTTILFTSDKLMLKIESTEKRFVFPLNKYLKVFMKMVSKCQDAKGILMEFTLVSFSMVKDMVKENGFGIMDKYMKDNGSLERKMVMVFGNRPKEIHMKVNGY